MFNDNDLFILAARALEGELTTGIALFKCSILSVGKMMIAMHRHRNLHCPAQGPEFQMVAHTGRIYDFSRSDLFRPINFY